MAALSDLAAMGASPLGVVLAFVLPPTFLPHAGELASGIGVPAASQAQAVDIFKKLYACYMATDASLAEINPLILEGNGGIKALDAKPIVIGHSVGEILLLGVG